MRIIKKYLIGITLALSLVLVKIIQWVSYYAKGARRNVETIWYNSGNILINSVGYGEDEVIDILPR